jgi:hypothetical protein
MTRFDYSRPLSTANRLLAKFGQTGAIRRTTIVGGSDFDPGEEVVTDHPAVFVVTAYAAKDIDGSRVLAADKKAMIAPGALTIEPTPADKLVDADGAVYNVVHVGTIRPAETTLLWVLQVRR